jgi:glutamine synthetase
VEQSFDRVRVLWPDHLGLARGKYVPASLADRGVRHSTGLWALGYDREMTPETPGSLWSEGLPDMDAVFDMGDLRPSWEPNTKVVIADLVRHGEPVAVAPRAALHRATAAWSELGFSVDCGLEFEAYVYERGDNGEWRPINTPGAFVYGTGSSVDPYGLIEDIWAACELARIPLESVNSEYDAPQFEFTLRYSDAQRAADNGFLFKVLAREVAERKGLMLTFMGKPLNNRSGSGLHINMSLRDEGDVNALNDPAQPDGLSLLARQCVAGMLEHHRSLAGLCAPTVNAYKRLRPGSLSGYWANWGYDHRGATVRIPPDRDASARLEHRLSDGAAPVHTAVAAVLQAARLGVVNSLVLGAHETGNGLNTIDATIGAPNNLSDALDALVADQELVDAVGAELVAQFVTVKRTEWQRFSEFTTDWELREYQPFL